MSVAPTFTQVGIDPSVVGLAAAVGTVVGGPGDVAWVKFGSGATDWQAFPTAERAANNIIIPAGAAAPTITIPIDPSGGDVEISIDANLPTGTAWFLWCQPNGAAAPSNLSSAGEWGLSAAYGATTMNNISNLNGVTAWLIGNFVNLQSFGNFVCLKAVLSTAIGKRRKLVGSFSMFGQAVPFQYGTFFHVDTDITTPYSSLVLSLTSSDGPPPVGAAINFQPGTIVSYRAKGYTI
jgi:hypothetical protein